MYFAQIQFASPSFHEMLDLRLEILKRPLGLGFELKDIQEEYRDIHLGAFDLYDNLIGCLVLSPRGEKEIQMRQVAVVQQQQQSGIGSSMVKEAEVIAHQLGFERMFCHARKPVVPFYTRLAYQVEGDEFIEVNLPHLKMWKKTN